MKYIDAEKLKEEIERQLSAHDKVDRLEAFEVGKAWNRGHRNALENILSFIDSLQEQSEVDLEKEVISYFQGMWPGIDSNTPMTFMPPAIMRLATHFYELGKKEDKHDASDH